MVEWRPQPNVEVSGTRTDEPGEVPREGAFCADQPS